MLDVTYASEVIDADLPVVRAAEAGDGQVRLRCALAIYADGNYTAWPGQSWMLRTDSVGACDVRDTLRAAFAAIRRKGPKAVTTVLDAL